MGFFNKKNKATEPSSSGPDNNVSITITGLLSEKVILITEPPEKKSELLRAMVKLICDQNLDIPLERTFQAVMEREKVTSTFMENGIAVPHARLANLSQHVSALAILPKGLPDSKVPDKKTHFVFLFLSDEKALTSHLQILSKASWLFQNQDLREKLLQAQNPQEAIKFINELETQTLNGPQAS